MLPDFTYMYLPAEEILDLKRDELMREFQEIRLLGAARQANPGFAERARVWIARLFRAQQRIPAPRQSYIDSAIRLAA
jgi:hypothetical protein